MLLSVTSTLYDELNTPYQCRLRSLLSPTLLEARLRTFYTHSSRTPMDPLLFMSVFLYIHDPGTVSWNLKCELLPFDKTVLLDGTRLHEISWHRPPVWPPSWLWTTLRWRSGPRDVTHHFRSLPHSTFGSNSCDSSLLTVINDYPCISWGCNNSIVRYVLDLRGKTPGCRVRLCNTVSSWIRHVTC